MDCTWRKRPGGESGITGCMHSYAKKSIIGAANINLPEEGHLLAPWVSVTFQASDTDITVGNDSSTATTPPNVAVIQSFEYGQADGLRLKVVVQDQQGGSFNRFIQNMVSNWDDMKTISSRITLKFRYGWTKSGCNVSLPYATSPCYYAVATSVESYTSEGKIIYEIGGVDVGSPMFEGSVDMSYGGDGYNGMYLVDAVTKLLTDGPAPNVETVNFYRFENGRAVPAQFRQEDAPKGNKFYDISLTKGPRSKWLANSRSKIEACLAWLNKWPTIEKRGWVATYNFEKPGGEINFWEDRKPISEVSGSYWDQNSIGTYIVNGGKKSSVIEFNPRFKWNFNNLTSVGGAIGAHSMAAFKSEGSKTPGRNIPGLDAKSTAGAGHPFQSTADENQKNINGANMQIEAQIAEDAAARVRPNSFDSISADLIIVGDPSLIPPSEGLYNKNCGIIYINPFYINEKKDSACGDWTVGPACNNILSHKGWQIKHITHRIESGSFTTILSLFLSAPGVDTSPSSPYGGWKSPTN